jgi:hypothetical protein
MMMMTRVTMTRDEMEDALFFCAARDMISLAAQKVGMATMEDHRFRSFFGAWFQIVKMVLTRGRWPAPQNLQAEASALVSLFFEGLSVRGPWMCHCWRVKGLLLTPR